MLAALNIGKIEWHDMQSTTSSSLRAEMRVIAVLRAKEPTREQPRSTKQTIAAAAAESEEAPQVTLGGEGFQLQGQRRRRGGDLGNPLVIPRRCPYLFFASPVPNHLLLGELCPQILSWEKSCHSYNGFILNVLNCACQPWPP